MIAQCNLEAQDNHEGDPELITIVIEEISNAIQEKAEEILAELEENEDLNLFSKNHIFTGSFEYTRFPNANFENSFSFEMKSFGDGYRLSVKQQDQQKAIAISNFTIQTEELKIVLSETKEGKTLVIECTNPEETQKLKQYLEALIKKNTQTKKPKRKTKVDKARELQNEILEIEQRLNEIDYREDLSPDKKHKEATKLFHEKRALEEKIKNLKPSFL